MIASCALLMVPVIIRSVASTFGPGHLSAFNYAMKLVELPLATLITTIATVAYPKLCHDHLQNNSDQFQRRFQDSLIKSWVISLIVFSCGWPLSGMAVELLFGQGKISTEMLIAIADLTKIALLSVPLVGVNTLLISALNAKGLSKFVVKSSLQSLLILSVFLGLGVLVKSPNVSMLGLPAFNLGLILLLLNGDNVLKTMVNWSLLLNTMIAVAIGSLPIWITFEFFKQGVGMRFDVYLIGLGLISCLLAIWFATHVVNQNKK
jgi:peptidoglycan biosynthesis protein MviN/MurJ (putative lipid II flippase)